MSVREFFLRYFSSVLMSFIQRHFHSCKCLIHLLFHWHPPMWLSCWKKSGNPASLSLKKTQILVCSFLQCIHSVVKSLCKSDWNVFDCYFNDQLMEDVFHQVLKLSNMLIGKKPATEDFLQVTVIPLFLQTDLFVLFCIFFIAVNVWCSFFFVLN